MVIPLTHESTPVFTRKTKSLSKRTSRISKFLLLFNLLVGSASSQELVSSDRFILKIIDRTISYHDISFQLRNLEALNCVYSDSFVVNYFDRKFIQELNKFVTSFPKTDEEVRPFLHGQEPLLKKIRHLFKMLRYSEDQNKKVSQDLTKLIREGAKVNNCKSEILYKEGLKTNFISLMEMELYLRSRYESQMKSNNKKSFEIVRPSIDLFVDSLDKQFSHEYYW